MFANEREKFFADFGVVAEDAEHAAGRCERVDLLHSAHHHAHVTIKIGIWYTSSIQKHGSLFDIRFISGTLLRGLGGVLIRTPINIFNFL
jgi:hypothetical protein